MPKGTLYIFCGKMASGKSTLARRIAEQRSLTLVSEDALLTALYPDQIIDVSSYVHFAGKVKLAMKPILVNLLRNGTSVVLDFPANTVNQRTWIREVVEQAAAHHEFHYLNISDEICKVQLKERAVSEPQRHATDTTEMFESITRYFEPPSDSEGFIVINHERT